MERSKYLADRLEEVLLSGTWIANTNYQAQIKDVTWTTATAKKANLNSIAELTYHVNYYLAGIIKVFEGGTLDISDKYSFDLQPIQSASGWEVLINTFLENAHKFVAHVRQMSDDKLDTVFVKEAYGTYLRNIEGVIEHAYYHLGQIVIIKKMISSS